MKKMILVSYVLLASAILGGCGQEASTEKGTELTKAEDAADSVMDTAGKQAKEMANTASAIAESGVQKAQQLIDQAMQYINDGRLDLAEGAITQLESMEDSLPDSIKSQIENLKNLFAARQSSQDVSKAAESAQDLLPGQIK